MAGIAQAEADAGEQFDALVVVDPFELAQHVFDVAFVVQRFLRLQAAARASAVFIIDVGGGQSRRVFEHDLRQVAGGALGVDRPAIAALAQQRQAPDVVDVRVRQDHRVEPVQVEVELRGIALVLVATGLDHAAVEQDAFAGGFDQMTGAGDFTGSTEKAELHASSMG